MAEDKVYTVNLNPGQFIADTNHLSTAAFGAYVLICFSIVTLGQDDDPPSLPDDDDTLASIARLSPAEWRKIRPRLCDGPLAVLVASGGRISQARVVEEIEAARARIAAGRTGGAASAAARRRKRDVLAERMANDRSTIAQRPFNDGATVTPTVRQPEGQRLGNQNGNGSSTTNDIRVTTNEKLDTRYKQQGNPTRERAREEPSPSGTHEKPPVTPEGPDAIEFVRKMLTLLVPKFEPFSDIDMALLMRDFGEYFANPYLLAAIAANNHAQLYKSPRFNYFKTIVKRLYAEGWTFEEETGGQNPRDYVLGYLIPSLEKRPMSERLEAKP